MFKKIIPFLLLAFFFVDTINSNILLQKPKEISNLEIDKLVREWETQFTWKWRWLAEFTFSYQQQEAGFVMRFLSIPIYSHNYASIDSSSKELKFRKNYYFAQPLKYDHSNPQKIDFAQLVDLLKYKKFIFYIGAGVSAGNVATMDMLEESLKMNKGVKEFLKEIWKNPQAIVQSFSDFCESALYSLPTPAHYALQKIAQHRSICILTENFDLLQQRTGIAPILMCAKELDSLTSTDLQEIEIVVCVGLSHDDRGFLSYYKENNLKGMFIALDLGNPNYLSNMDFIVQEDLQSILPNLALRLTLNK